MHMEDIKYRNIESYYDILRYSILPNLSLLRKKGIITTSEIKGSL